jgi:hypothetical protein
MWRSVLDDRDGCADGPTDVECSAVFEGHKQDVYSVVCRDVGNSIVSAGYDRMVREWDVPTGRQVPAYAGSVSYHALVMRFRSSK